MNDPSIHIYAPPVTGWGIVVQMCPTCEIPTTFLRESWEWHPAHFTCLSCGDSWSDGELMERPFMWGWRKKSVEEALKRIEKYKEELQ